MTIQTITESRALYLCAKERGAAFLQPKPSIWRRIVEAVKSWVLEEAAQ